MRQGLPAVWCILVTIVSLVASSAYGAVLTFDQGQPYTGSVELIDQAYGDRVNAGVSGDFRYLGSGGYTPHVEVSYGSASQPVVFGFSTTTGSPLTYLARGLQSYSDPATMRLTVTLTADPGWTVQLRSFTLGSLYNDPILPNPTGLTIQGYRVQTDDSDVCSSPCEVLDSASNVVARWDFGSEFRFSPPIEAQQLTLVVDLTNFASDPRPFDANTIGVESLEFSEQGPTRFDLPFPASAGEGAGLVSMADLDLDGDEDLVSMSPDSGLVAWSANEDAAGTFGPRQTIASNAAGSPAALAIEDLDQDGDPDVLVAWFALDSVVWYENLGGGDFGDPLTSGRLVASGLFGPGSLATADGDGDGDPDVLVASQGDTGVRWLLNDGTPDDGGWTVQSVVSAGAGQDARPADVDGDGDYDVVALGSSSQVAWYENAGVSPWPENVIDGTMAGGNRVAVADFDDDGDPEVLVSRCGPTGDAANNRVSLYLNRGREATSDADGFDAEVVVADGLACPGSITAADITQDGRLDLIVTNSNAGGVSPQAVFLRQYEWDLRFAPPVGLPGSSASSAARVADVDEDGDPDVVVARSTGGVEWHRNRNMHYLSELWFGGVAADQFGQALAAGSELAVGDLDRNGRTDLVVGAYRGWTITVYQEYGSGFVQTSVLFINAGLEDLLLADLDGDGLEDIVVAGEALEWYRNLGPSADSTNVPVSFDGPWSILDVSTQAVAAADLDRDGDVDLVLGGPNAGSFLAGGHLSWAENDGTPFGGGWTEHPLQLPSAVDFVVDVTVGDVNLDGYPDIVAGGGSNCVNRPPLTCESNTSIQWFAGGAGASGPEFTARPVIPTFAKLLSVYVETHLESFFTQWGVPYEEDALPDFLAGTGNVFSFYQQQPDGSFAPEQSLFNAPTFPAESIITPDFTLDNRKDIGWIIHDAGSFGFAGFGLCGNGGRPNAFGLVGFVCGSVDLIDDPRKMIAADFDSDGDDDYAVLGGLYLRTYQNARSQVVSDGAGFAARFPNQYTAPRTAYEGDLVPIQAVFASLGARPGDSAARIESLNVRFVDPLTGAPLTSDQANALISELFVYRDSNVWPQALAFDPAEDILVATIPDLVLDANGVQSITLPANDPNLIVAAPAEFHVVARIAPGAGLQDPKDFGVSLKGYPASPALKDLAAGTLLRMEQDFDTGFAYIKPTSDIVVDAYQDLPDPDPSNGVCNVAAGECSLRGGVQEANARAGTDRIDLPAGTFTLTAAGQGEDAAVFGDLDVTDTTGDLLIRGAGVDLTVIDAGGLDRVFDVHPGASLTLENLTVTGGSIAGRGGGLLVRTGGQVILDRCAVTGNVATGNTPLTTEGTGGGIGAEGNVTILRSVVSDNTAEVSGGGIFSTDANLLAIDSSTIARNVSLGNGGGIWYSGPRLELRNSTISANEATLGGGLVLSGTAVGIGAFQQNTITLNRATATEGGGVWVEAGSVSYVSPMTNNILAGNFTSDAVASPDEDCSGMLLGSGGHNLSPGCFFLAGTVPDLIIGPGVAPALGPLQDNGGPTPTHALLPGSLAIDGGNCAFGSNVDQRGIARNDLPAIANFDAGDGCDVGAYEVPLGDALARIEVPVRWCVLEGSPSFDFNQPIEQLQAEVNEAMRQRHELVSDNVYYPQAAVRFRSAGNINVPDYPILPDRVTSASCPAGKVVIQPEARDFKEFMDIIAQCREAWEQMDPTIKGVTAVNIDEFVGPDCQPLDVLGLGGRAEVGDVTGQMAAGRLMVVDRVNRIGANPPDEVDRLLGHELGHAAGGLRHGNGRDDSGQGSQCADGILDNDDDSCQDQPRFDGSNLMQYRGGTDLSLLQIEQLRLHVLSTMPDLEIEPDVAGLADGSSIEEEFLNVLDFEFLNVLDFEFLNVLDFEFLNVLDFEFLNVLDFEEAEVLDFEFLNVLDFGMTFSDTSVTGTTTLYATTAGLPWPTPIRPDTAYFWYLDLDEGGEPLRQPSLYGFPGGQAQQLGVDLIVSLGFSSFCDANNVCSDSVEKVVYAWDEVNNDGYDVVLGPVPAEDQVQALTVGLVQQDVTAEREDQALGMLLKPTVPNSTVLDAAPDGSGFAIGDPVSMEVVTALACELTLPDGTEVDCQCLDCADCPGYPGCEDPTAPGAEPVRYKRCSVSGLPCLDDSECTGDPADSCDGSNVLIVADEPGGSLTFEAPVLPTCEIHTAQVQPGGSVSLRARDFPTTTGRAMTVFAGTDVVGYDPVPVFGADGTTTLTAVIPTDSLSGPLELRAVLDGFATAATCVVSVEYDAAPSCTGDPASGDSDGDGFCDDIDVCPVDPDPAQTDSDSDGVGDSCDACPIDPDNDSDGDGWCANEDNCPLHFNEAQTDRDGDGLGDACDPDPLIETVTNDGPAGEGDAVTVSVTAELPPVATMLSYWFDCDGDAVFEVGPSGTNFTTCVFVDDGSYTVNVRVTSDVGGEDTGATVVTVNNVAPALGTIDAPLEPVAVNGVVDTSAAFTDPGILDTHTATWDWGDGSTSEGIVIEPTDGDPGSVAGSHVYALAGVYTVSVALQDDSGDSDSELFQFVVVYDPTEGFVTGGGYIDSPPGAYLSDPLLTGVARFGFVAKYKKGATVPTGNTEFEFEVADLQFESVDYQWLVVAGHKAQFKGSGTINGQGDYGFLLFAADEKLTPSLAEDQFRIKIWDKNSGDSLVYDNEIGAPDDAEATTPLGGGSIVIHVKN